MGLDGGRGGGNNLSANAGGSGEGAIIKVTEIAKWSWHVWGRNTSIKLKCMAFIL